MIKYLFVFLFLSTGIFGFSQTLPGGVTMETIPCTQNQGFNSYRFQKNNEMISAIDPSNCFPSYFEEENTTTYFAANFYLAYKSDTFDTEAEAMDWMIQSINDYYKPVIIEKWQTLEPGLPGIKLKYPAEWTYRTENTEDFFGSKSPVKNKLLLTVATKAGHSDIFLVVRTPNTDNLSTEKAMDWTAMWIRALNFKENPATDIVIGGKTFKAAENTFMMQMYQHHYWYADKDEIIYINYNMLKDEQVWYPAVLESILKSISW